MLLPIIERVGWNIILSRRLEDKSNTPWGYKYLEIYDYLGTLGYSWFTIVKGGRLTDACC